MYLRYKIVYYFSPVFEHAECCLVAHASAFDEIGKDQRHRTRNSCQTVHEDIGVTDAIRDKGNRLLEVPWDIKGIMILGRDGQMPWHIGLGMAQGDSLSRSQHSPDLQS